MIRFQVLLSVFPLLLNNDNFPAAEGIELARRLSGFCILSYVAENSEKAQALLAQYRFPEGRVYTPALLRQEARTGLYGCFHAGIGTNAEDNALHCDIGCASLIADPHTINADALARRLSLLCERQILIHPIAHIHTDFPEKFGIPRQSGMVDALKGEIHFVPMYRSEEALRGITDFSHLWLVWQFSQAVGEPWHATIRPPRLGGNRRVGVFASRSPFRPNHLALSCVRLSRVENHPVSGPVLHVSGVDMLDGTPILDIKPYIPLTDCMLQASEGFTAQTKLHALEVSCPDELLDSVPAEKREGLLNVLRLDPRPGYKHDADTVYGLSFAGMNVAFQVGGERLTVLKIEPKR